MNSNNLTGLENQTMNGDSNIGGLPYILNYLGLFLPYSIFSFIGVIIGLTGKKYLLLLCFHFIIYKIKITLD